MLEEKKTIKENKQKLPAGTKMLAGSLILPYTPSNLRFQPHHKPATLTQFALYRQRTTMSFHKILGNR